MPMSKGPKRGIIVLIETDYPNADGITHRHAKELFEYFSRKPYMNAEVNVLVAEENSKGGRDIKKFGDVMKQVAE